MDSSMNGQSKKKEKCDFTFFFIFNGLSAVENGGTTICRGNAERNQGFPEHDIVSITPRGNQTWQ